MIQRIQSLYLLLTTLLSVLFLSGSFVSFKDNNGAVLKITFKGIVKYTGSNNPQLIENVLPVIIVVILVAVLSFAIIFLFNKRNIQLLLSKILVWLVILLIPVLGYYSFRIISEYGGKIMPTVMTVLPLLMLLFSILAFRGIRKDDQLVQSYDRLR
jgi:hypothetical protein